MTKRADPEVEIGGEIDATCKRTDCLTDQEGIYVLMGNCANCGCKNIKGTFTRGHAALDRSDVCPNCGCKTIYWGC